MLHHLPTNMLFLDYVISREPPQSHSQIHYLCDNLEDMLIVFFTENE